MLSHAVDGASFEKWNMDMRMQLPFYFSTVAKSMDGKCPLTHVFNTIDTAVKTQAAACIFNGTTRAPLPRTWHTYNALTADSAIADADRYLARVCHLVISSDSSKGKIWHHRIKDLPLSGYMYVLMVYFTATYMHRSGKDRVEAEFKERVFFAAGMSTDETSVAAAELLSHLARVPSLHVGEWAEWCEYEYTIFHMPECDAKLRFRDEYIQGCDVGFMPWPMEELITRIGSLLAHMPSESNGTEGRRGGKAPKAKGNPGGGGPKRHEPPCADCGDPGHGYPDCTAKPCDTCNRRFCPHVRSQAKKCPALWAARPTAGSVENGRNEKLPSNVIERSFGAKWDELQEAKTRKTNGTKGGGKSKGGGKAKGGAKGGAWGSRRTAAAAAAEDDEDESYLEEEEDDEELEGDCAECVDSDDEEIPVGLRAVAGAEMEAIDGDDEASEGVDSHNLVSERLPVKGAVQGAELLDSVCENGSEGETELECAALWHKGESVEFMVDGGANIHLAKDRVLIEAGSRVDSDSANVSSIKAGVSLATNGRVDVTLEQAGSEVPVRVYDAEGAKRNTLSESKLIDTSDVIIVKSKEVSFILHEPTAKAKAMVREMKASGKARDMTRRNGLFFTKFALRKGQDRWV